MNNGIIKVEWRHSGKTSFPRGNQKKNPQRVHMIEPSLARGHQHDG